MILEKYILASTFNSVTAGVAAIVPVLFAMTDELKMVMVGAVVTIVTSTIGAYFSYKSRNISREGKEITQQTAVAVNGKMEEFKRLAEKLFHAEGLKEGKEQAETKAAIQAVAKEEGKAEAIEQQTKDKTV